MKVTATGLAGLMLIEPQVHVDPRGNFFESFNQRIFEEALGRPMRFVQDNHSLSQRGVLRGLHYQIAHPQGKLVRVISGEVFDVSVDLRRSSPTFGQWYGVILSAENRRSIWIPEGFAHGFLTLSEQAESLYKITDYWSPGDERCIAWNDPDLAIDWPLATPPLLSAKDAAGVPFKQAEVFD
jgi:dTDP-4-dehydrorhamnose 3,5-epimerase